jgi:phospholipid transport system substrate-binding protein
LGKVLHVLKRIHLFIAALLLLVATVVNAATTLGPLDTVKSASDRIIGILSDPTVPRQERWTRIAPVIADSFDFLTMSRSVLSRQWQSATPAQQQQFVEYFSQYIEGTYRSKIEAYSGQRIEYRAQRIRGDRAAVDSFIHTDNISIPVSYFLRRTRSGQWKAYDVTIEGVSLVNSYRETYAAIAKTSGISGVLARVKARARAVAEATPAPNTK